MPRSDGLWGFSRREHIIGDSVSATTAEIVTAPTKVNANSVNSAPVSPPEKADRHIDRDQYHRHRNDRAAKLARGDDRRLHRRASPPPDVG